MLVLRSLAVLITLVLLVPPTRAQSILVRVHVGNTETTVYTYNYGDDVRIDLGYIAGVYQGFDFIRVFDSAASLGDISRISLYKDASGEIPTDVRLLVAHPASTNGEFPVIFDQTLVAAGHDWGLPLQTGGPRPALVIESTVPTDTRIILAARVDGDVLGSVACGQVYTLQALTGTITGDVIATRPDDLGPNDGDDDPNNGIFLDYTIQDIRAKQITGNIIAGDDAGPPTDPPPANWNPLRCSIRSVQVGAFFDASSTGIRGNILAYGGHIRSIDCFGHIGTATAPVLIHAGYGLGHLECSAQVNGQTVARNVYADLRTNFMPLRPTRTWTTTGTSGRSA